jgi:RecB family exonuclease
VIRNHEIQKDLPKEHEIGSDIHKALQSVYSRHDHFEDIKVLSSAVEKEHYRITGKSELHLYQNRLWMQRLSPFFEREIERFREVRVLACEKKLEREIRGIRLYGEIDRIDQSAEGLEVLDYKSGSYKVYTARTLEGATDFQLEFYYLLASNLGEVSKCAFYDLKDGRIVDEVLLDEKLEMLYGILDALRDIREINFEMTEKLKDCKYCEFIHFCQRGVS